MLVVEMYNILLEFNFKKSFKKSKIIEKDKKENCIKLSWKYGETNHIHIHELFWDINLFDSIFNYFIVVQLLMYPFSPHYSPLPYPPQPQTFNPHSCCLCACVLYTCSLSWHFPFFELLTLSSLHSGDYQFVPYFHVFISIFLICFFVCWLGSTYRWDHMVFVFHHLAYFS